MKLRFDPYKFNRFDSNGVPVHWKSIPWADGYVYIYVLATIGARYDPVGREGLAHFFEHLPFNGCKGYPTLEHIEHASRTIFMDTLNALTGFEYTFYYGKAAVSDLGRAMGFLGSFVTAPLLQKEEVERERSVILQELWRQYKSEQGENLAKTIRKLFYNTHPFSQKDLALGWHDTIALISRDELARFHAEHYHRGNIRLILVGDIDERTASDVSELLTRLIPIGKTREAPEPLDPFPAPAQREYRLSASEFYGTPEWSAPKSTIISVARAYRRTSNREATTVMTDLIRRILFKEIRGSLGAMYSADVSNSIFRDHMMLNIETKVPPKEAGRVESIISDMLSSLQRTDEHAALFEEIKAAYICNIRMGDRSIRDLAKNATMELATMDRIVPLEEDLDDAAKVTYDDIAALAAKEFKPESLFWYVMRP
ncbi:MAG: insulinase family protein [Patescibacteria group bacterium]|nr:insulinase family protein [Patescibacteria group bacterium]